MTSPAFQELKARMHRAKAAPGTWRDRPQTDQEAWASLRWCQEQLYQWEFFGDFEVFAAIRLGLRNRIQDLERRLGTDEVPF